MIEPTLEPWNVDRLMVALTPEELHLFRAAPALLEACEAALAAMSNEWLYQTGQFCRPQSAYPQQGTVHGDLSDAISLINQAIAQAVKK